MICHQAVMALVLWLGIRWEILARLVMLWVLGSNQDQQYQGPSLWVHLQPNRWPPHPLSTTATPLQWCLYHCKCNIQGDLLIRSPHFVHCLWPNRMPAILLVVQNVARPQHYEPDLHPAYGIVVSQWDDARYESISSQIFPFFLFPFRNQ